MRYRRDFFRPPCLKGAAREADWGIPFPRRATIEARNSKRIIEKILGDFMIRSPRIDWYRHLAFASVGGFFAAYAVLTRVGVMANA